MPHGRKYCAADVRLDLIDVFSGEADSSTVIEGRSGLVTLGDDHPQYLLATPITEYLGAVIDTPAQVP
ncbi:DUF4823 domain-containing protein [Stutzerimonas chloritidismutans]|uniref:DUF4823 domain-containing protein n=1 Tax=Stutzerimonas chloritidismutans TaxID=203192 RepID=UPI003F15322A